MNCRAVLLILCASWLGLVCGVGTPAAPATSGPVAPVYLRLNQVGYLPAEPKLALALTDEDWSCHTMPIKIHMAMTGMTDSPPMLKMVTR